jgi:hypothetical protein
MPVARAALLLPKKSEREGGRRAHGVFFHTRGATLGNQIILLFYFILFFGKLIFISCLRV